MSQGNFPKVPTDELEAQAEPNRARLEPGTLLDNKFKIVRKLGSGTVGHVYEAVHSLIGHRVALKLLSREMAVRQDALMLLLHEARVANTIQHPNIVQMTDLAQTRDGQLYLVMELLQGEDLGEHMRRKGPLSRLDSMDVVLQMCAGLSAAHSQGVYHRDLKPQNIFIVNAHDPAPGAKILDFGLSRVRGPNTRSLWYSGGKQPVGTPLYCPPEHITGPADADHRADVYSLGVILYQLWTGRLPFDSPSVKEVLHMQQNDHPPKPSTVRPGMTEASEKILLRALEKNPDDRYQTVGELAAEIEDVSGLPQR